jgi:predicted permease
MITFAYDIKYGIRQLMKSPGFTIVAIVSLALGIGVNTAIFSILNAIWMRSLPVKNPHELRIVNWSGHNVSLSYFTGGAGDGARARNGGQTYNSFPYPLYQDFKKQVKGCSDIFAFFELHGLTMVDSKGALTTDALMVSGDFFEGYGAQALIGRTLNPRDESSPSEPASVITYRLWEKEFNLDPGVIGQMIALNGHQFTIVGVMPRAYCSPQIGDMAQIYVPMSAQPLLQQHHPLDARNHWWINIMARLEPRADESQVVAAMEGLFLQTLSAKGQSSHADDPHIILFDGSRGLLGIRKQMATGIAVLMAAVGLVLLIACANLAGLLLARGAARQKELTIRAALGARRGRLIRQLLTESLILSLIGAGLGLLVAMWIKAIILGFMPNSLDTFHIDLSIDHWVLLFTLCAALVTSVLFGLLPAIRITHIDLCSNLKGQKCISVPGLHLGNILVAAQVSLSVLLIVGAGLLMQTLINLYRTNLGFSTDKILVFGVNPAQAGYKDANSVRLYDQIQTSIASLPGVRSVAMSSDSLLGGRRTSSGFSIPGRTRQENEYMQADVLNVSEAFFQTMGIPLLRGRIFEQTDTLSSLRVVIANKTMVRTYFANEDPLGQTIRFDNRDFQIVGLCGDAKYNRIQSDIEPTLYFSHRQAPPGAMFFEIRTTENPLVLVPAVRRIVSDLDRTIPLENVSTQLQLLKNSITPERIFAFLCSGLAIFGILLSCIGLYGLLAFMVSCRTGEIGVRLTLGARPYDIACPVIRNALWLAGFGLIIGIPLALVFVHLWRSFLYGVKPHDPVTIVASILLVLSVAALAAWIPARRASRVDPMEALRYE